MGLGRRAKGTLAAAALTAMSGVGWSAAGASTPPEPLAEITAVVMAQRTVDLAAGDSVWTLSSGSLAAGQAGAQNGADPRFLVVTAGSLTATDSATSDVVILATGEATFLRPGVTTDVTPGDSGASFLVPGLEPGSAAAIGAPFDPGAGARDVDLWGDVVAAGGSSTMPASADGLPSLIIVTGGSAEASLVEGGGPAQPLTAGTAASFTGAVTVRNTGADTLRVAAITLGAVAAASTEVPASTDVPVTSDAEASTTAPPPATTAAPSQTTAAPPQTTAAPPETTAAPPAERAPSAGNDSGNATDAPSVSVNVLSNDDLGNPAATITDLQAGGVGEDIDLGNGHFRLSSDGTATLQAITPPGATTSYSTSYTITNSQGSSTATVTLTITASADN